MYQILSVAKLFQGYLASQIGAKQLNILPTLFSQGPLSTQHILGPHFLQRENTNT